MKVWKKIWLALAVITAKTVTMTVRRLRLGAASVMPGAIARRLYPQLLPLLWKQIRHGVILVVGTNGKTTTSLLLRTLLQSQGWRVAHNDTGANLINGLLTALMTNTTLLGKVNADIAILEVDENIVPLLLLI